TIKALTAMLPLVSPDDQPIISSMIMYNMDGEGIQDVRDYYRGKLLRQGVMQPTEEERKQIMAEMQNQPPDPNTQYLQAAAAEAEAKAQKAKA
ncbi:portal protein, partial [Acinetobacter baumannii]